MSTRNRYLLVYDIRNAKRLRRVHQVACDYGYPLQYSVFACDLTRAELIGLRAALSEEMHTVIDSVGIFDLGPATGRGIECVEFLGPRREVPEQGREEIW